MKYRHVQHLYRYPAAVLMAVFILLLSCSLGADAQYIKHLNAHQFLRASNVYHVMQDRKGFLWFCTNHGLVKYNGHSAEYYTRQKGLADDMVFNVYEDHQGRIWAFCYNGRYCFIEGDSIHNEHNDTILAGLPHTTNFINCMAQAKDSSLYMGFISRSILHFKGRNWEWAAVHTSFNNSLIVTDEKITYTPVFGLNILAADRKHRLLSDDAGIKIFLYDSLVWKMDDLTLDHRTVTDLYLTDNDEFMVSTLHGLEIIYLKTNKRIKLLQGIRISGCYTDVAGNIWISTLNNGIYLLHQELDNIHTLEGFDGQEWTIINDNKLVLIKDKVFYELRSDSSGLKAAAILNNIPNYYNPVLLTDRFGIFYDNISKYSRIISVTGTASETGRVIINKPKDKVFIKKMHAYGDRDYFAYGDRVVYYYRFEGGSLKLRDTTMYSQKISASCQNTRTGDVYFNCGNDLYRCNFNKARNEPVFSSPRLANTAALISRDSGILIATNERQFYAFYPPDKNGRLTEYNYGIPVRNFTSIYNSPLLLVSDVGDYLVTTKGNVKSPQKLQYPFSSTEYEQIALLGRFCLVQLDGKYYYFDTSLLNKHQPRSSVYLKRLVINGRDYSSQDIDIRNTIKLDIQISVGLLDFGNSIQAVKYRLLGPEGGNWNSTNAMELAFVLRKTGTYEIQIMPDDEGTSTPPVIVKIRVHTPFLRSATFLALCCFTAFLICGWIIYLFARYRKRHFMRELNYLRLEHRAINALLNPHFIFNSINNIQNLIHKSAKNDAAEYLAVLSRLIRQNLENLHFNLIPLENELALIERYIKLQNLRFSEQLTLHIDSGDTNLQQVHVPPLLVHTFVENAIVHGYRHKEKPLLISIMITRLDRDYLRITITDNGVGLAASAQAPSTHHKTSIGISFNRNRLKRLSEFYKLDQSIILTDLATEGGEGTKVVITLYARLKELFEQKHLTVH